MTTYDYDDANNLLARTDARGVTTRHLYDEANRIAATWDDANANATQVRFRYDGACNGGAAACPNGEGQLVEVVHPLLDGQWARERTLRDARGRESGRVVERGNRSYTFANGYDAADRPISRTYPDGTTLSFELDGAGRLVSVPGYVDEIAYDPRGQAARTALHNGAITTQGFDARLRVKSLATSLPTGPSAQDLTYAWDRAGNLESVTDARAVDDAAPSENAAYGYDALYRLTGASLDLGRGPEETLTYQYDRIDNLTSTVSSLGAASAAHVGMLRYGENGAGPHAVTTVGADGYAYDAAGQVVERLGLRHEWDHQGRLVRTSRVAGGAEVTRTAYGADWTRTEQAGQGHASEYVAADYEIRDGIATIYVRQGEKTVARIEKTAPAPLEMPDLAPANPGTTSDAVPAPDGKIDAGDAWLMQAKTANLFAVDTSATTIPSGPQVDVDVMLAAAAHRLLIGADGVDVTYEHTDHLGTVNVETDETGTVTQRAQAYPYGTPRHQEGSGWSRHGYTGMERDAGTGLQLHGARWLDTRAGRWMGADPAFARVTPKTALAFSVEGNAYLYAAGQPTTSKDDTGLWSSITIWGVCEPVHQMAIANTLLNSGASGYAIRLMQEAQIEADTHQGPHDQARWHAMRGTASQSVSGAAREANQSFNGFMRAAMAAYRSGNEAEAYRQLGFAIHLVQDATSPSHRGFQVYHGPEGKLQGAVDLILGGLDSDRADRFEAGRNHAGPEAHYPGQNTAARAALEGVTRWTYDVFTMVRLSGNEWGNIDVFSSSGQLQVGTNYDAHHPSVEPYISRESKQ